MDVFKDFDFFRIFRIIKWKTGFFQKFEKKWEKMRKKDKQFLLKKLKVFNFKNLIKMLVQIRLNSNIFSLFPENAFEKTLLNIILCLKSVKFHFFSLFSKKKLNKRKMETN